MNALFHSALLGGAAWLRIALVAVTAWFAVDLVKACRRSEGATGHHPATALGAEKASEGSVGLDPKTEVPLALADDSTMSYAQNTADCPPARS